MPCLLSNSVDQGNSSPWRTRLSCSAHWRSSTRRRCTGQPRTPPTSVVLLPSLPLIGAHAGEEPACAPLAGDARHPHLAHDTNLLQEQRLVETARPDPPHPPPGLHTGVLPQVGQPVSSPVECPWVKPIPPHPRGLLT